MNTNTITCPRCLFTSDVVRVPSSGGQCEMCDIHDKLSHTKGWEAQLRKICKSGGGLYDCVIGISGGQDSSTLLYAAVKHWGLTPLVIHFDNNWNSPQAEHNMKELTSRLGVNAIRYQTNKTEYDLMCKALLHFGLQDADIPNDLIMTKLVYEACLRYGIKYHLNGHDYKREGSSPRSWSQIDGRYMADVYEKYTGIKLKFYNNLSFWDQIYYGIKGLKQVRPFHYQEVDYTSLCADMKENIDFRDYGGKHAENLYTEFVGSWLLPKKFGIDKRITYLSARMRSGEITRNDALNLLAAEHAEFDVNKLPHEFRDCITGKIGDRNDFKRYDFRKYRLLVWVLVKLKVLPSTLYYKFCR